MVWKSVKILTWRMLEKLVPCMWSLASTLLHNNGPWTRNTPLSKDTEPTQPVLCNSSSVGISSPCLGFMDALLSLIEVIMPHGSWPTPLLQPCSLQGRDRLLPWSHEKGVCSGTNCHGHPMHTAEVDFARSFICASKTLFHSLLDCVVVALVTAITNKPWAKVFRVLPCDWLTAAHYSAWQNRTL